MPFPQMTTRRWMIAVAILAIALRAPGYRRAWLMERARYHERESESTGISDLAMFLYGVCPPWGTSPEVVALYQARLAELRPVMAFRDYHRERAFAFERAAATWALVPVPAAPSPPKPSKDYLEALKARMIAADAAERR